MDKKNWKKCVIEGCTGFTIARGLCNNDYVRATRQIKKGLLTWKYLEKNKMALEKRPMQGDSNFAKQLNRLSTSKN